MNPNAKLINRKTEIRQLREAEKANVRVNLLIGNGGLGKTRLLQELPQILNGNVVFRLDFDNFREYSIKYRLELALARQISEKTDQLIQDEINRLEKLVSRSDSETSQKEQKDKIFTSLTQEMINATKGKVLILFDTTEKLDWIGEESLQVLFEIISRLPVVFCVFAGREQHQNGEVVEIWKRLRAQFPHANKIILQPFSPEASEEYLNWKEERIHLKLEPEERDALLVLARGKPILLDLAVEFVARSIDLSSILEINLNTLQALDEQDQKKLYTEFDTHLVQYLRKLDTPLVRLITLLAHIYPIYQQDVAKLLGLAEEEAASVYNEAKKIVFVKDLGDCLTLHDEMRMMILEYVWKEIDIGMEDRKEYSLIAEGIYREREQEIKRRRNTLRELISKPSLSEAEKEDITRQLEELKRQRETATETWLFHALFARPKDVFEELVEISERIRRVRRFSFVSRIIQQIKQHTDDLSPDQQLELEFMLARNKMDLKKFEEARSEFLTLLVRYAEKRSNILNLLGFIETHSGNLDAARDYELESLKLLWKQRDATQISDFTDDELLAIMYTENWTGYIFRLLEDVDRKNLGEAIWHYDLAIKAALELNTRLKQRMPTEEVQQLLQNVQGLIASVSNNQGYLFGLQRKFTEANMRCTNAIRIWQRIDQSTQIAFAEIALGILERDQEHYQKSIQLLQAAINRLNLPGDAEYLCRAKFHLGWSYWFDAEETDPINLSKLEFAAKHLQIAKSYAEEFKVKRELPGILHQLASVVWRLGRSMNAGELCNEARELNKDAIEQSIIQKNWRYWVDSILGEAEFDWSERKGENLKDYLERLEQYQQNYVHFPLYYGRMHRIIGDYSLSQGNDTDAIVKYEVGFELMNQHGGYGPYSIDRELQRFSKELSSVSPARRNQILQQLSEGWQSSKPGKVNLQDWCGQQIIDFQIFGSTR